MASFPILLKARDRRWRRDLIHFLEALSLYLHAGFDLGYGWPETLRALEDTLAPDLAGLLHAPGTEGMLARLDFLARSYPVSRHRHWFRALHGLYASGAPLGDAVRALSTSLRKEQARELEDFARRLPSKLSILLILFFLPAAFLLLFVPLIHEILFGFPR